MKNITILTCVIVFLSIFLLSNQLYRKDKQIKLLNKSVAELQQRANMADSLDAELFPAQVELRRFQIAFEIFARRHPVYAEIYADIISDETE